MQIVHHLGKPLHPFEMKDLSYLQLWVSLC